MFCDFFSSGFKASFECKKKQNKTKQKNYRIGKSNYKSVYVLSNASKVY